MPFIGNQPALSYTSFAKQDFTTSATTAYTLSQPVANENEIALFINFVRQEPTTAYTASGTSLTLTSATSASDDMYCVFLGKAVQTVNPPNSSVGTSQLDSSLDFSSKTITLADNMKNTPAFYGEKASNSTISRGVITKITGLTTNEIDSNSAFDGTTFTVPSGEDGKYFVAAQVSYSYADIGNDGERSQIYLYKNGSSVKNHQLYFSSTGDQSLVSIYISGFLTLVATDTVELYAKAIDANNSGSATIAGDNTSIGGYKLIGV